MEIRRDDGGLAAPIMYRTTGRGAAASCSSSSSSMDDCSKDSGISSDSCCSNGSAAAVAAGPTDFAAMMTGSSISTQSLNRELASMRIQREDTRRGEILALEEEEEEEDDGIVMMRMEEDVDENAQDGEAKRESLMPPPALPSSARRAFGDISNSRIESPVSKRFSRHATTGHMAADSGTLSTGGLRNRNRKRLNRSPVSSPFGSVRASLFGAGKRWRVAEEAIDEHSEVASTSFATRKHSVDCTTRRDHDNDENEGAVFARPSFHRVQSTSILEKGKYAPHNIEDMPAHLDVSYRLPILEAKVDSQAYRRIDGATLAQLMREMGEEFEKSYALIDCRYPYEYEGGHIRSATNVYDPAHIDARFFAPRTSLLHGGGGGHAPSGCDDDAPPPAAPRIPIFYCEFSQKRGPNMAAAVRALDRIRNRLSYPRVDHAEMYVLNGGYNGFHGEHGSPSLCAPFAYTRMDDERHSRELAKFIFHKKSFAAGATISRLPLATTQAEKQAARAAQLAAGGSPIRSGVPRRASRRALYPLAADNFTSPQRAAPLAPIANPQFS